MSWADTAPSSRPPGSVSPAADTRRDHTSARGDGGQFLASALTWNMLFSATSGGVLLVGGILRDQWLGVHGWLLVGLGAGLLLFATSLLWLLSQPSRLQWGARATIAADAAWIAVAAGVLTGFPTLLSPAGRLSLLTVTMVVVALAVAQLAGLRRIGGAAVTGATPMTLRVERLIDASPDRVWETVVDAGGYARFAPGIASTTIVSGEGEGMIRLCTDDHGGTWAETCTLWDEGSGYRMTVDVDSYPLYYRALLHELEQTWTVEPTANGTRLTQRFDGAVKLGMLGRIVIRLLGNRRRLEAILDGYERAIVDPSGRSGPQPPARDRADMDRR